MRLKMCEGFVALACLTQGALSAQWLHYPTAGIPKLPNGKPNLSARAPRTAAGKPDFSGIWIESDVMQDACPPGEAVCIRQEGLPARAVNIGVSSPEQLTQFRQDNVFRLLDLLPYRPWAADLVNQRRTANSTGVGAAGEKLDPHVRCLPPSFPRAWAFPQYKKIVQTPGLIIVLHEFEASYRQIFTDGRPLPTDPQPSWNGYSTGRWDGDTLVVETIGFRDDLWLDMSGSPLTGAGKVTERFRRVNYGKLEIQVTVDDPKAYTKPWTVRMDQSIVINTDLLDDICLENERDVAHYVGNSPAGGPVSGR
jgi:hypothetical protein